jgi:hypothetical protein
MITEKRLPIGICVPTIRACSSTEFLKRWTPFWSTSGQEKYKVILFIHEDHPTKSFQLDLPLGVEVIHTCHADVEEVLGEAEWIIPRGSGACRSFPMYLAWQSGCEYILTLDDDCYPVEGGGSSFLDTHLAAFRQDRWFRTVSGEESRGIPYGDRGQLPVLLNHGLWTGVPDLDGPTSLVRMRNPTAVVLRASCEVIPPGMWFTLCAMNVCYHRSAIPAAYNLLMGLEIVGFDRFDDIWSGLLLKKIADHLGYYITSGVPFVCHVRASNVFCNIRKEILGIELHEHFWKHIAASEISSTKRDIASCYASLAEVVRRFSLDYLNLPCPSDYFERLADAMLTWLELFANQN